MNLTTPRRLLFKTTFALSAVYMLSACGGSGSQDSVSTDDPLVGTFVDSAVSGLHYVTDTQSGVTNEAGEYLFYPGETITFSVGSVQLPSAPATTEMTPLDLAGTDRLDNTVVVNILQFLQTLDQDQDAENGIQLETAAASISNLAVDFTDVNFSTQAAVQEIVNNAPANVNNRLVDADVALEHFGGSLIMLADPPHRSSTATAQAGDEFYIVYGDETYDGDMIMFSRKHFALTNGGQLSDGKYDTSSSVWHLWNRKQGVHQFVGIQDSTNGSLVSCWADNPKDAMVITDSTSKNCGVDAITAYLYTDEEKAIALSSVGIELVIEQQQLQEQEPALAAASEAPSIAERETVSLAVAQAESIDAAEAAVVKTEDEQLALQVSLEAEVQNEAAQLAAVQAEADAKAAAETAATEELAKRAAEEREAAELEAARLAAIDEAAALAAAALAAEELAAARAAEEEKAAQLAAAKLAEEQAAAAKAAEEQKAAELAAAQAKAEKEAAELAAAKAAEEEALAIAAAKAEQDAADAAAALALAEAEAAAVAAAEKEAADRAAALAEEERIAAQIAADKAEAERLAAEQAEADLIAAAQAEADRIAAEQAEADRLAAEQAEADRLVAEQAEADRLAAEQAEADRLAAEQAEADRIAAEQAEADRLAAEQAQEVDAAKVTCDAPDSEFKAAMLAVVNESRSASQQCGINLMPAVRAVEWHDALQRAASVHVADMAKFNFFDHTGSDGLSWHYRVAEQGFPGSHTGENIAYGPSTVLRVHTGLMNSSGHCRNTMRENYTHVGAACVIDVDDDANGSVRITRYWSVVYGQISQ